MSYTVIIHFLHLFQSIDAGINSLASIPTQVLACQTNAIGCIKNNGPGASFQAPAEVSGCHVFPPVGECAKDSTPSRLGPP